MDPDRDNEIKIRWADDGSTSDYIKAEEVQVVRTDLEPGVGREAFVAACTQHPERTAKMYGHLKADAAVLEAKIAAVWRWADTVADGEIGRTELIRLGDRAGKYKVTVAAGLCAPIRGPRGEPLDIRHYRHPRARQGAAIQRRRARHWIASSLGSSQ